LLLVVLIFQLSVLPDTLGLRAVGRVLNASALVCFLLIGGHALASGRAFRAPPTYLAAILLLITGLSINIARNLSPESIRAAGSLLPFAAALGVPFLKRLDVARCWRIFYRFMLVASIVAALEYAAVFTGILHTTAIETERGPYLKGVFSYFLGLGDGQPHYRMYGLFVEPGTYAMYLLPAIAYAWLRGKRWPTVLLLGCFYFTDSLGGALGLLAMGGTYLFWRSSRRPVGLLIAVAIAAVVIIPLSGPLRERYEEKGQSAAVRESNVSLFRDNFVSVVTANPFGLPLTGKSLSELENVTSNYLGSNFEIYTFFVEGGIIASVGYTMLLLWMAWRNGRWLLSGDRDLTRATALVSLPALLLFVFQRETVLASALFAFLFAPPLLRGEAVPAAAAAVGGVRHRRRRTRRRAPALVDESG
jgi:hypothetical protein